jgi:histidine phosphotransferase ChpT
MTDTAIDLASLLCSRLCHDMLSPVGALSTTGWNCWPRKKTPKCASAAWSCSNRAPGSVPTSSNSSASRLARLAALAIWCRWKSPRADRCAGGGNGRITVNWTLGRGFAAQAGGQGAAQPLRTSDRCAGARRHARYRRRTARRGERDRGPRRGPKIAFDPVVGKALDGLLDPGELSSRTAPAAHDPAAGLCAKAAGCNMR